ncbi:CHAP domain-containing protein [Lactococcus garvieae]|uniref:CHAP domain-containing protein n=1 Tax=Lactococcus formosensis TaxID=1281486 RepID=UPI0013FD3BC7|nr:CHAP domain-containing protein [Lactococcus formosensis]NHI67817.1 CHAP domain-containing protein [Lactococcus garvieae]
MSKIYDLVAAKLGQVVDFDGMYGGQCADLSTYAVYWATGARITGNAINTVDANNINAIKAKGVTPEVFWASNGYYPIVPQKGDILVENPNNGGYGHVSVVESATPSTVTVIEQNYDGSAQTASAKGVERRIRAYLTPYAILRIPDASTPSPSGQGAGTYKVTASALNVRDYPSTKKGKVVAAYSFGQSVNISEVITSEGMKWGTYTSYSGAKRYISMDYLKK